MASSSHAVFGFSLSGASETRKMRRECCWLSLPLVHCSIGFVLGCAGFVPDTHLHCCCVHFLHFDWLRIPTVSLHVCRWSGAHGAGNGFLQDPAKSGCSSKFDLQHRAKPETHPGNGQWHGDFALHHGAITAQCCKRFISQFEVPPWE